MEDEIASPDLGIASRIRRSSGRGGRVISATAKLTKDELDQVTAACQRDGKALGEWCRDVLLREARRGYTDRAIFTELIAFRAFANGVLRELATGRPMKDEDFSKRVAEAKKNKHQTAAEVLEQYQPNTEGAE